MRHTVSKRRELSGFILTILILAAVLGAGAGEFFGFDPLHGLLFAYGIAGGILGYLIGSWLG